MKPNETMRARLDLNIFEAVEQKFASGREHYGETWAGDRPVIEGHDDALDVIAYVLEEQRTHGPHPKLTAAKIHFLQGVGLLREYLLLVGER